ncbi:YopT-type cysteine protease domain-containing protein [Proteus mirabilis]
MTVWANLDKNNDNFGLYDPNFGMVEFSSKRKFISYLNRFLNLMKSMLDCYMV